MLQLVRYIFIFQIEFVLAAVQFYAYKSLFSFLGESGVVYAVKLYPAGATTNSQDGVTDLFGKCLPVLEEMVKQNMPLLVSKPRMTLDLCFCLIDRLNQETFWLGSWRGHRSEY